MGNGYVQYDDDKAYYFCNPGYTIYGSTIRECTVRI